MLTLDCVCHREGNWWIGWLEQFPNYHTQGRSLSELKANLKSLHQDISILFTVL
jgi:predicted RNase H-like HicB family nuclease